MQRQSCDLVAAINAILDVQPAAAHVMMMEDDWLFCPSGFDALRHFMAKAYRYDSTAKMPVLGSSLSPLGLLS